MSARRLSGDDNEFAEIGSLTLSLGSLLKLDMQGPSIC
jgi:hypothetical protein